MGNFDHASDVVFETFQFGTFVSKGGGKFLGFKSIMNLNDHVFTHGTNRVFWTMVPGLLHGSSPLREVERSKVENLKKRTMSLVRCLLQILVHSNPLHS